MTVRARRWRQWAAERQECDACGGTAVHIVYGRLGEAGVCAVEKGDLSYGGPWLRAVAPRWRCTACARRWGSIAHDPLYAPILAHLPPGYGRRTCLLRVVDGTATAEIPPERSTPLALRRAIRVQAKSEAVMRRAWALQAQAQEVVDRSRLWRAQQQGERLLRPLREAS